MQLLPVSELVSAVQSYLYNSTFKNIYPLDGPLGIAMQEGGSPVAYQDEFGNWTIGIGHTPAYAGETWSNETMVSVFFNDIYSKAYSPISKALPWLSTLSPQRQWVNYNASFNMGSDNWLAFTETLQNMQSNNLLGVLEGMMDSDWYRIEVPNRVKALMYQYYFDEWVVGYLNDSQTRKLNAVINTIGNPPPIGVEESPATDTTPAETPVETPETEQAA